jgi:BASS family bile acid:Na+ symporter
VSGAESAYTVLITLGLLLNGLAVACAAPVRDLLRPLGERRLLLGAVAVDLVVVPAALLVPAVLLGLPDAEVAGLVLLAAASTGPIGVALTRIARGDVPATVSIVTALGAANLVTVPALMALLLPDGLVVPVRGVTRSLLLLLVLPLAAGAVLRWALLRLRQHPEAVARTARRLGAASSVCIALAAATAFAIDPAGILSALAGPPALLGLGMVAAAGGAVLTIARDDARRRALWLTATARSVGVALTVAALHLPDADATRTTVLAVGGLTQAVPVLLLLGRDRWRRRAARTGGGGGPRRGDDADRTRPARRP